MVDCPEEGSTTDEVYLATDGSENVDRTLRVLADESTRLVVHYLVNSADDVATYGELADYITSQNAGGRTGEEVKVRLHHVILPKLAESGLLEHDPRDELVRNRSTPLAERLVAAIEG